MTAPVDDLCRSVSFALTRAAAGEASGDGLTLEGHAAVFDQETRIDSWEGSFVETIRRGAFKKTIRERTPVMQFDHGRHPLIGSIPIGRIMDLREDDEGLYVSARLTDNWLIQPVRDAIRDETVDGMSFRFEVIRQEWRDNAGKVVKDPEELARLLWDGDGGERGPLVRTLIELRVPELGPVVFPAYEGTSVGVRARTVADSIDGDDRLTREIRRALAADVSDLPERVVDELPNDPELRGEVARAVLFRTTPETSEAELPVDDEQPSEERTTEDSTTRSTDAPPAPEGHPSPPSDAPPAEGHPSQTTRAERMQRARRDYVTSNGVGRRF